jgi:hypothetical protein
VPGFSQPNVLLVAAPSPPEREWLARCARLLRGRYARWVEPCAGAFAIPAVALREQWTVPQLECSDVSLFTSVVGTVCAGRDLAELDVRVDGESLELDADPVKAAAEIIYRQLVLRMDEKPDEDYWHGIRRDLAERSDAHRERIAIGVGRLAARFPRLNYRPRDMWAHIEEVKDDPATLISLSPPTYLSGYEKFFDTGGRLTWRGPEYGLWDPKTDFKRLALEAQSWKALLLCVEGGDGDPSDRPFYARRGPGPDWSWYGWTNKPDVLEAVGLTAIPRPGHDAKPMGLPILAPDHEITADSTIRIEHLEPTHARWYKELWAHRIDPKDAGANWMVLIDNRVAGIAGYSYVNAPAIQFDPESLLLTYGFGPQHPLRLPRLVAMLALNLSIIRRFVPPWHALRSERVATAQLSRHPEAKLYRGVMKLKSRKPDPVHGFRLLYEGNIVDRTPEETLALWLQQEQRRQAARSSSATT